MLMSGENIMSGGKCDGVTDKVMVISDPGDASASENMDRKQLIIISTIPVFLGYYFGPGDFNHFLLVYHIRRSGLSELLVAYNN